MSTSGDDELVAALLLAVAPQAPASEVAERLRLRLRSRLQRADDGFVAVRSGDGWRPFVGGTRRKLLHDDGQTMSWLVHMPAGTGLPAHRHDDGIEECLVLDGEVLVNDVRYAAGDYVLAPRGSEHYAVHSDRGATIFLRSPSRRPAGVAAPAR